MFCASWHRGVCWLILLFSCLRFARRFQGLLHHHAVPKSLRDDTRQPQTRSKPRKKLRLLHIVTSMSEFDTGKRETVKGYDRFTNTFLPVLNMSIQSMVKADIDVDAYLITHYNVTDERRQQLRTALPKSVKLTIWDDATPFGYPSEKVFGQHVVPIPRSLARQHRYVIKDLFQQYDLFSSFEDDMLIKADHVLQFLRVSKRILDLQRNASSFHSKTFHGPMSLDQLRRLIPGLFRVEAALPGFVRHTENLYEQIPIDYQWSNGTNSTLDASVCCHVPNFTAHSKLPSSPSSDGLFFWETSIDALGVRQLPNAEWVLCLAGMQLPDYWSGDAGYFTGPRPNRRKGRYMNNQGGWMGLSRQIFEWNTDLCDGNFLPYVIPVFVRDWSYWFKPHPSLR
jgi:hypothetical protein